MTDAKRWITLMHFLRRAWQVAERRGKVEGADLILLSPTDAQAMLVALWELQGWTTWDGKAITAREIARIVQKRLGQVYWRSCWVPAVQSSRFRPREYRVHVVFGTAQIIVEGEIGAGDPVMRALPDGDDGPPKDVVVSDDERDTLEWYVALLALDPQARAWADAQAERDKAAFKYQRQVEAEGEKDA